LQSKRRPSLRSSVLPSTAQKKWINVDETLARVGLMDVLLHPANEECLANFTTQRWSSWESAVLDLTRERKLKILFESLAQVKKGNVPLRPAKEQWLLPTFKSSSGNRRSTVSFARKES
jgi:hypothetical protein